MSGPDTHKWWYGRRARLYALMHRNPASNLAVVHWSQLEPDMRVLDIGCGTGAAVNAAAPDLADGQAIGVNPSPDFIPIARRHTQKASSASFQVATAEHLPFDKATFDVVWSVHSTHHWHHVGAGIGKALRVLRHGGRFLVVERHNLVGRGESTPTKRTASPPPSPRSVSPTCLSKNTGLAVPASF
jgi:ubiquinone/menaquinone biosynthesis C-methylase UbiE